MKNRLVLQAVILGPVINRIMHLSRQLLQNASIEDEDLLHDLWAELLVAAMDPSIESPRSAFIEIIKQMEPIDVKIIKYIYDVYESKVKKNNGSQNEGKNKKKWVAITPYNITKSDICRTTPFTRIRRGERLWPLHSLALKLRRKNKKG